MFEDFKSIVSKKIKASGLKTKIDESKYLAIIESIIKEDLPPALSNKIKILYVKNKVLLIASLSDSAKAIIMENKTEILLKLHSQIEVIKIDDFKFIS